MCSSIQDIEHYSYISTDIGTRMVFIETEWKRILLRVVTSACHKSNNMIERVVRKKAQSQSLESSKENIRVNSAIIWILEVKIAKSEH